jgi:hypothetical protein
MGREIESRQGIGSKIVKMYPPILTLRSLEQQCRIQIQEELLVLSAVKPDRTARPDECTLRLAL